jgi:hypothetical protein
MWKKILKLEQKIFSAPYKWFIKKGLVKVIKVTERLHMSMEDLYESLYDEP